MNIVRPNKSGLLAAGVSRFGQQAGFSLDTSSVEGGWANANYDRCKQSKLASYPWRFALRERELTPMASHGSDYTTQYTYAYKVPADCLATHELFTSTTPVRTIIGINLFGDELYSDESTVTLRYIANVPEESFTEWFADAMIWQIAFEAGMAMTNDSSLFQLLHDKAEKAWKVARNRDARAVTLEPLTDALAAVFRADTGTR